MKKKLIKPILILLAVITVFSAIGFTGCGYCQHQLSELQKVPATCQETGLKTAYECVKCGKLFAYTDEKGLYEISEREVAPLSGHTVGTEFTGKNRDGSDAVNALEDMAVYAECAVCGEDFAVDANRLIAFSPSDNVGTHIDIDDNTRVATEYVFESGVKSGTKLTIEPLRDSGKNENANVEVPFEANKYRYLIMFVYNDSNVDVDIKYGAERNGERCLTDVSVPAKGYAAFTVNIKFSGSDPRSWHELYMMQDLSERVKLTFTGYYYAENKLKSISLRSKGRVEFAVGEVFDASGIVVVADFGENVTRVLKPEEYEVNLTDKILTEEDTQVIITYKNKTVKYDITVREFERTVTLVGATFADGTQTKQLKQGSKLPDDILFTQGKTFKNWMDYYGNTYTDYTVGDSDILLYAVYEGEQKGENYVSGKLFTSNEAGFNPSDYGFGKLTDGVRTDYNAWGSNRHSSSEAEIWLLVDLGELLTVNEVYLYPREADGLYFPVAYRIEVSEDGENFTEVFAMECDGQSLNRSRNARYCRFGDVQARYVRITATELSRGDGANEYYLEFSEIEIYRYV